MSNYRPGNVSTPPTHWWKLDETSGDRADSALTGQLSLTDHSVGSATGYLNTLSASFNGSSQYFDIADNASFDFSTGNFTLRCRCKFTSAGGGWQTLMSKVDDGGTTGWTWKIAPTNDGGGPQACELDMSGTQAVFALGGNLSSGTLYDFLIKRESSNLKFYINSVQTGGNQTPQSSYNGNAGTFKIGQWGGINFFGGIMEDAAVWKGYAVSDTEITNLYTAFSFGKPNRILWIT